MCIVSAIYPHFENQGPEYWSKETYLDFKGIMEQAEKIDKSMGNDDCPDTMKKNKLLEELKKKFDGS
jgi:hypothetical protein